MWVVVPVLPRAASKLCPLTWLSCSYSQLLPQLKIAALLEGTRKWCSLGEIHSWINQLWPGPQSTEVAAEGLSVFLSPLFLHQGIIIG